MLHMEANHHQHNHHEIASLLAITWDFKFEIDFNLSIHTSEINNKHENLVVIDIKPKLSLSAYIEMSETSTLNIIVILYELFITQQW